ncbi:MAG: ABC transporter ATP-binding protein [Nitrososphaerota archaeon]|jgi:ABC-2 type transport system ATP-binding protein|nr:ABC transporter ATP-binding protein [Nitrososphaerota archaeon]
MDKQRTCIEVNAVSKRFGNTVALKNLSFKIPYGEKFALLGPNGAGKSTTLKLLVGFLNPDLGEVTIGGVTPSSVAARSIMGYLPEDASPYHVLSVRENLEYVGTLRQIENVKETTDSLLDFFDLREYEKAKVGKLSRGTTQKLALALAIIHKPKVLLLDEPLNYLDIPTQEKVITLLTSLSVTSLVSTHIMSVASRLTKNVIMLAKGAVLWEGSIDALKKLGAAEEPIESIVARMMIGAQ